MSTIRRQGIFWLLTIPFERFVVPTSLPVGTAWLRGQHEVGESGYEHWQLFVGFTKKRTLAQVVQLFPGSHAELSRSQAAAEYVWKDATRVPGSQFELGAKPIRRNSAVDWESVWESAKSGDLSAVPANVRVVSYRTLRAIAADHDKPVGMERVCDVFWGTTVRLNKSIW